MLFEPAYKSPHYTGASWSAEIPWKIFFFLRKVPLFLFPGYFFTIFFSLCAPCSPIYNCRGGDVPGLIWIRLTLTPGLGYIALYCCVCNLLCFILQQLSQYCNIEPFFFNLKQAVCIVSLVGGEYLQYKSAPESDFTFSGRFNLFFGTFCLLFLIHNLVR